MGGFEESYVSAAGRESGDGRTEYLSGALVTRLRDLGEGGVEVTYKSLEDAGAEEKSVRADFVVGADGPSSVVRKLLDPEAERKYVGYAAWRGTVKESLLTAETNEFIGKTVTLYFEKGLQILTYKIPALNGTIKPGECLANIVWYQNYTPSELQDLLTDTSEKPHTYSLGINKIKPAFKIKQQEIAAKTLPEPLAELFQKVESPFIQAVTDCLATKSVFMNGKVVLVGDALAGVRPHTTCGTTQAALHAFLLGKVFEGEMGIGEWGKKAMEFGNFVQGVGVKMGDLSQFGDHPDAGGAE
ncbi:hypothetical protein G7Y89_g1612 [Cudoniella acicularis]|uniref:2,6-dihydroxypyridine 3-monooxygenase substrate binding domain-containing protein n=1 Tax=Cudoniella acicularis TaxID=354080 RepID=A0A8H4WA45_9HELO|nr:hypothetical protein G7Y89_g1612 [Cudoniella acicularis]